jgi:hypothetical protein
VVNNLTTHLLSLDSIKEIQKHDTVHELRLVIETIDLTAILGNGTERGSVVKIES